MGQLQDLFFKSGFLQRRAKITIKVSGHNSTEKLLMSHQNSITGVVSGKIMLWLSIIEINH